MTPFRYLRIRQTGDNAHVMKVSAVCCFCLDLKYLEPLKYCTGLFFFFFVYQTYPILFYLLL